MRWPEHCPEARTTRTERGPSSSRNPGAPAAEHVPTGTPILGGSGNSRPCGVRRQQRMCQRRRWKDPRDERCPSGSRGWRGECWKRGRRGLKRHAPALERTYLSPVFLPAALPLLSSPSSPACHVLCVCVSVVCVVFSPKKEARVCCFVTGLGVGKCLAVQ